MFQNREFKITTILLLTFALLLITGVFPQDTLAITAVMIAIGILVGLYAWLTGRKKGERPDERSDRCSLLATQNGFLVGVLLTTFTAVVAEMGFQIDILSALRTIWGLSITVYFLSYLAYKRLGLA